ncbi:heme oxygenase [Synechococcus sp. RSCCF101]|uniref:biliverdin-producing heme oxygenase n=1 Tax=Synechococcus sp. RSCCF101 TaxID=2511069 RepID=UPI0012478297|nr:biliverdin-producing heme oxygenase [Synechococcus sp. RSCCF101]QEY31096.1 heme oxygenase [Synechococcus sp. RSCCF101]
MSLASADPAAAGAPSDGTSISDHARPADAMLRRGFGPRVRRLHARIGKAHHKAEGMVFSRALLEGRAEPLQLAALLRALRPGYGVLEELTPRLAAELGAGPLPWESLRRCPALDHDLALMADVPATPPSAAAAVWVEQMRALALQAPHRFLAHLYVRYGGDLSGGQQLAVQANAILRRAGLPEVSFWVFDRPIPELKQAFHDAFEAMELSPEQEAELLDEAEAAFRATQALLAELETIAPAGTGAAEAATADGA